MLQPAANNREFGLTGQTGTDLPEGMLGAVTQFKEMLWVKIRGKHDVSNLQSKSLSYIDTHSNYFCSWLNIVCVEACGKKGFVFIQREQVSVI